MRIVYGVNPVRELLRAGAGNVSELWIAEATRAAPELERLARDAGAKFRVAPRARLDRMAGSDRHQGVVAVVAEYEYREVDDLLVGARARGEAPLLVVLDGIEDPQNLGAIVRSTHALGGHGVVIAKDRAVGVTPTVAKASAGAIEHLPIARVVNVAKTIEALKEAGVWSVVAAAEADRDLSEVDLASPIALIIGSEGRGVRPLVRKSADHVVRIPMAGRIGSLNASAAAAICLYETVRQRSVRGRVRGP